MTTGSDLPPLIQTAGDVLSSPVRASAQRWISLTLCRVVACPPRCEHRDRALPGPRRAETAQPPGSPGGRAGAAPLRARTTCPACGRGSPAPHAQRSGCGGRERAPHWELGVTDTVPVRKQSLNVVLKNEILPVVTAGMDLESTPPSDINQRGQGRDRVMSLTRGTEN